MDIQYIESRYMPADIFTKFYPDRKEEDWVHHRSLINILHKDEVPTAAGAPATGSPIVRSRLAATLLL